MIPNDMGKKIKYLLAQFLSQLFLEKKIQSCNLPGKIIFEMLCHDYIFCLSKLFKTNRKLFFIKHGTPIVLAFTLPNFSTNLYLFRLTKGMMNAAIQNYNIESKEALIYHILQPTHR